MENRRIGGLEVSLAGLGCVNFGWWVDEPQSISIIRAALDSGVLLFDCADEYGDGLSEEYLGKGLESRRKDAVIVTKFGGSPAPEGRHTGEAGWVRSSCEGSLRRLGTDYLDVYMMHRPDPHTPIAETLEALTALKSEGKVREIACSNFSAEQLREAAQISKTNGFATFAAAECGYNLLDRTAEETLVPACAELGIPLLPYFPLASGMLTGKYRRGDGPPTTGRMGRDLVGFKLTDWLPALFTPECFDVVEALEAYAKENGHSLREMALAWVASRPWIASVITGAMSVKQVEENVAALGRWKITQEDEDHIKAITTTEHAFSWVPGGPADSKPPEGTDLANAPG